MLCAPVKNHGWGDQLASWSDRSPKECSSASIPSLSFLFLPHNLCPDQDTAF